MLEDLWQRISMLGVENPYKPPFLWQRTSLYDKKLMLALDEIGNSYVELCILYSRLYAEATSVGSSIRREELPYEQITGFISTAWASVHAIDKMCKFLASLDGELEFFRVLAQKENMFLSALKDNARKYRNADSHRIEQFANNVKKLKHGHVRGSVGFVYIQAGDDIIKDNKVSLTVPLVFTDLVSGEQGSVIANLDGYPKKDSIMRVGASCICLFYEKERFDLSEDFGSIIRSLSSGFHDYENQIVGQIPAGKMLTPQIFKPYVTINMATPLSSFTKFHSSFDSSSE